MSLDTRSGSFITNNGVSHLCVPFMTFAGTKLKPQKKPTQTNQICVRGNHRCSLNVNTVNYLASNQKKNCCTNSTNIFCDSRIRCLSTQILLIVHCSGLRAPKLSSTMQKLLIGLHGIV